MSAFTGAVAAAAGSGLTNSFVAGVNSNLSGFEAGVIGTIADSDFNGDEIRFIRANFTALPSPQTVLSFRLRGTSSPPSSTAFSRVVIPGLTVYPLWVRTAADTPAGTVVSNDRFWTWTVSLTAIFANGTTYPFNVEA